jgi:hypothetical protein
MTDHTQETTKTIIDGLSVVTVVGTLVEMLPSVAALFTVIWTGIRIWETDTVQRIIGRKEPEDAESQSSSTQSDGDGRS